MYARLLGGLLCRAGNRSIRLSVVSHIGKRGVCGWPRWVGVAKVWCGKGEDLPNEEKYLSGPGD